MANDIKKEQMLPEQEDTKEFMEMLRQMDGDQKQQIKGIMIGMQMMKQRVDVLPA